MAFFTNYNTKPARARGFGVDRRKFVTCPHCERSVYGKLGWHLHSKQHKQLGLSDQEINEIVHQARGIEKKVTQEQKNPQTLKFKIQLNQKQMQKEAETMEAEEDQVPNLDNLETQRKGKKRKRKKWNLRISILDQKRWHWEDWTGGRVLIKNVVEVMALRIQK